MTPDEIITTLAEFEGWTQISEVYNKNEGWTAWRGIVPATEKYHNCWDDLPNYLCPTTGLSHCRRVQLLLTDEQHEDFRRRLKWAIANEMGESTLSDKVRRAYISASASQVAHALAATIRREGL